MDINVKYFGRLTDISKCDEEVVTQNNECSIESFIETLQSKYPKLKELVYVVFVNKVKAANMQLVLTNSDEVILMPAYSGG